MKLIGLLFSLAARARTFDVTPEERRHPCGKTKNFTGHSRPTQASAAAATSAPGAVTVDHRDVGVAPASKTLPSTDYKSA